MSYIDKTLIWNDEVSLAVLDTTDLVAEAIERHRLSPTAAVALGKTMTVAAYLCSWLKGGDDSLSVTVSGNGVGGKICVSGNGRLEMRGFLEHPDAVAVRSDGEPDVCACVGDEGTVTVIREEEGYFPFTGTCGLVSGDIAQDFSAYFARSEQRPTAIVLEVRMSSEGKCLGAGGFMLQPLPFAGEESRKRMERSVGELSAAFRSGGAEAVLNSLCVGKADRRTVYYRCHCSSEKIADLICSLGRKEAEALVREEGKISVHCHYCNTDYSFDGEEVDKLFSVREENT